MLTLSGDDSIKELEKLFGIEKIRIDFVPKKQKHFTIQFDKREFANKVGQTTDYFAFYYRTPTSSDFAVVRKGTNQCELPMRRKFGIFFLALVRKNRLETKRDRTGGATRQYSFSFDLGLNTVQIETVSRPPEQRWTQGVSGEKSKLVREFSVRIANREDKEVLHISFEASLRPKGILAICFDRTKPKQKKVDEGLNEFDIPLDEKVKSAKKITFAFYLIKKPGGPVEKVEKFEIKPSEIPKERFFGGEEEREKEKISEDPVSKAAPATKTSSGLGPPPAAPKKVEREDEKAASLENESLEAGKTPLEATGVADLENQSSGRFAETPAFDLTKPGGVENILSAIWERLNRFEEKFDKLTGSIDELGRSLSAASKAKETDAHSSTSGKEKVIPAPSFSETLKKKKLAKLEQDIDKDFASADDPEFKPLIEWREKFQQLRRSFFEYMEKAVPGGVEKNDSEPFFGEIASTAVRKLDRINEKLCTSGKEVLGKELERAEIADFDAFKKELHPGTDSDKSEGAYEAPDLTIEYEKYLNGKCEDIREKCLRKKDRIVERSYRDEKQLMSDLENLIEYICTDFARKDFPAIKELNESAHGRRAKSPEEMDEFLSNIFKLFWIEEIPVAPGVDTFNPEIHYNQLSTKDTRYPHMKVVQVLGQGYRIGLTGRILRRVPVKVNYRA